MRKALLLMALVLLCTAWVVAQQSGTTAPAGSSASQSPNSQSPTMQTPPSSSSPTVPSSSGAGQDATSPSSSQSGQTGSSTASGNDSVVEGCLGGSAGNFTVTDKVGTVYRLDVPKTAQNDSILTQHVGESVQVAGTLGSGSQGSSAASSTPGTSGSSQTGVAGSSSSSPSTPAGSASSSASGTGVSGATGAGAGQQSIHVTKIGRGTTTCPGSANSTSAPKPPSK